MRTAQNGRSAGALDGNVMFFCRVVSGLSSLSVRNSNCLWALPVSLLQQSTKSSADKSWLLYCPSFSVVATTSRSRQVLLPNARCSHNFYVVLLNYLARQHRNCDCTFTLLRASFPSCQYRQAMTATERGWVTAVNTYYIFQVLKIYF